MDDGHAIVHEMFAAWNSGNVDRMTDFWAEDGDWIWEDDPLLPDARVVRGRTEVEAHLRDVMALLGPMTLEIDEITDAGDDLLVLCHTEFDGARSGVHLDVEWSHVIRFEAGRVRRYRSFTDPEMAMRAIEAD
jgi:ketosteroid isomerase-like protein